MNLEVVILAAGQGTRMKSKLPKVLHPLAGKSLVSHVVETAQQLGAQEIHVVVGHGGDLVQEALKDSQVNWVTQEEQLGTGHAVAQALPHVKESSTVLVLYGDVPLTSPETLNNLLDGVNDNSLGLLTVVLEEPKGYGRIIRDVKGDVQAIVEEKDATEAQRAINEGNTGIMAVAGSRLKKWLPQLSSDNAQGEYYLTDTIAMAAAEGMEVSAVTASTEQEVQGINSREQLANLERWHQNTMAKELMAQGVTLADPARLDVRGELSVAQDIFIDANVLIEGKVSIGQDVKIGPNVVIKNSVIGDGSTIHANCVIENARVEAGCDIGPFARLRPEAHLAEGAKVGNFVEIKKAYVGKGSKINHLSYVGDAELGAGVNVGAGAITCNYDGANKFKTEIEDGVFVGSNTALVAPIKVGKNATVGAGSTLSNDVESGALVVSRGNRRVIKDWPRPKKK